MSNSIRNQYLDLFFGDEHSAAVAFARDLMEGDAEEFKAGYTLENALIATKEVFPEAVLAEVEDSLKAL